MSLINSCVKINRSKIMGKERQAVKYSRMMTNVWQEAWGKSCHPRDAITINNQ